MTGPGAVPPVSVLLICDSYPPVMGGSEIEAQRVSSALIHRGHSVLVLCSGGPPMPPVRNWVDPAGVPVRILTRRAKGRWKDLLFAWRVAWTIWGERRNYHIVYFLMQGLHLASGLLMARALGKPIVAKISGSGVIRALRSAKAGSETVLSMLDGRTTEAIGTYEAGRDAECTEYLQERAMYYGIEHRWSESMFWKRRAHVPTTGSEPKVSVGSHSGTRLTVSGTTHPLEP